MLQWIKLILLLIVLLSGSVFLIPINGYTAQDGPATNELKQKAQDAFLNSRYSDAAAIDLEIAEKHPESQARRYAVQMLGTLYENNIVDIKKAITWDREYLDKYADFRQASFYRDKIASLEKLMQQEEAFKIYQDIRFSNQSDETMVKKFEALLKKHPDFLLRDKIQSELGYAYARMDKRRQSYLAFKTLAGDDEKKLSTNDTVAYNIAGRYWEETSAWGWIAWGVVIVLWVAVLLMKPWQQLTRNSIINYLIFAFLWALLIAIKMPTFYNLENAGDPIKISGTVIYIAACLNLTVLLWLILLTRGKIWQTRKRALRWLSPVLTLLMTTAIFYLIIIHQPNGPQIMDVFADTYSDWAEGLFHL